MHAGVTTTTGTWITVGDSVGRVKGGYCFKLLITIIVIIIRHYFKHPITVTFDEGYVWDPMSVSKECHFLLHQAIYNHPVLVCLRSYSVAMIVGWCHWLTSNALVWCSCMYGWLRSFGWWRILPLWIYWIRRMDMQVFKAIRKSDTRWMKGKWVW